MHTRKAMAVEATVDLVARVRAWAAGGERFEVEFKSDMRGPISDRDLVEAVVCLANGAGGVLLIGVEDDGTISGAKPRHEAGRTDMLRVQALVANSTQPPQSVAAHAVEIGGLQVLVIEVPDSPRVVGTSRGTYVRRAVGADGRPACLPYHAHEMLAHEVDRGAVDWAGLAVSGATWQDLDPQTLVLSRQAIAEPAFSSIEEWLGQNTEDYYRVLAIAGQGIWKPRPDAHLWVTFNLRAHHMQAQTIARRLEEAIAIWDELDHLVAGSALPDRVTTQLYDAVLGYRLRRSTYAKATSTEERTASRDLGRLVDLGVLIPRGEARGRHYVAGDVLTDLRRRCQDRRRPLKDPFPWMGERLARVLPG